MFGYNFRQLSQRPYIPLLYRLQEDFFRAGKKSIKVVPILSHQMRHIDICNTGLEELFQHEKGLTLNNMKPPRDHSFQQEICENCRSIFRIEMFESKIDEHVTWHGISTNGVPVSVLMKRPKHDPGYRLLFAGVLRDIKDEANPNMKQNEINIKLTSKEWHEMTGLHARKHRLEMLTTEFEARMCRDCEALNICTMSPSFAVYIRFELKWFTKKCAVYQQEKITRLKFDKHLRTLAAAAKLANDHCPIGENTIRHAHQEIRSCCLFKDP